MLPNWPLDTKWPIKFAICGSLVWRFVGQAREPSNLDLTSLSSYLAFESDFPCLRGSSSNSTDLLGSFSFGMVSLQNYHSFIHSGGGSQWPWHMQQLRVANLQQHSLDLSSQLWVQVGANLLLASASVPEKVLQPSMGSCPHTGTTVHAACRCCRVEWGQWPL